MRALTEKEIELIAGGQNSGGTRTMTITVTGNPPSTTFTMTFSPTGSGGSGDGGDSDTHQQMEEAKDTPCVHYVPEGVDEHQLNNEVKFLGDELANKSAADHNEWGAFVYKAADGQLYETDPFTSGNPDKLDHVSVSIPSGATVVGYIHTHPNDPIVDERELSDADQDFIRGLIANGRADSEMVAYINTTSETGVATTYAYDKTHRGATTAGCSL